MLQRLRTFILRHRFLSRRDKLVAVQLLDCFSLKKWACSPSYATLAAHLDCSERTIGRALRALSSLHVFRWRRRRRMSSQYAPNFSLIDDRLSAPSGESVNDRPYPIGRREAWLRDRVRPCAAEPSKADLSGALEGAAERLAEVLARAAEPLRASPALLATFRRSR
jgi:hypothetical protein